MSAKYFRTLDWMPTKNDYLRFNDLDRTIVFEDGRTAQMDVYPDGAVIWVHGEAHGYSNKRLARTRFRQLRSGLIKPENFPYRSAPNGDTTT